jgi:hypothetical protein
VLATLLGWLTAPEFVSTGLSESEPSSTGAEAVEDCRAELRQPESPRKRSVTWVRPGASWSTFLAVLCCAIGVAARRGTDGGRSVREGNTLTVCAPHR